MTQLTFPGKTVAEEARAMALQERQQVLEQARLNIASRQQKEANQDRTFRGRMAILGMPEMPVLSRLEAGNAMLKDMGMNGTISEEGLAPFTALIKKMALDQQKGSDLSVYEPAIESMFKSNLILPAQITDATQALDAVRKQQAERTTSSVLQPELDRLTTARDWIQSNTEQVKQAHARLQPGAAVQIGNDTMTHEQAANVLQQAEMHKAVLDRERMIDDKKTFYLRAFQNPAVRKAFETGRAVEALGLPIDDNALRARAIQLEVDGPQDAREERLLEVLRPLAFKEGPRLAEIRLNEQIQRNQRQVQTAKVAQALVTQNTYLTQIAELEHQVEAARKKRTTGKLTPDEIATITSEEAQLNAAIGDAQQASFRDAQTAGDQFQALFEDVQTQIEATKTQLARVPIAQTVALKQDLRTLEGDAKFYDNLMTSLLTNHPTKQAELRQQAYLLEQDGQTEQATQLRARVETMAREWGTLSNQVNAHAQTVAARGSQLNSAMARLNTTREKDEATNSLVKYAIAHKDEGLTAAFQNGLGLYASADTSKAYETIRKVVEDEGNLKLFDAQAAFAARREQSGAKESVEESLAHIGRQFKGVDLKKVRESVEKSPMVSVTLGKEVDKEIGQQMTESRNTALGAIDTVDAANRIDQALTSGAVTLGPTATIRNKADQVSQLLGVGGRDVTERLVNTRNVIRGLAQFAVAARKQLKGQGQVSDFEGRLIMKAEAGEIDDMTMPELKSFVQVTRRLAERQYQQHQMNLERFRATPDMQNRVPFFEVPPLPQTRSQAASQGFSIKPKDESFSIKRVK